MKGWIYVIELAPFQRVKVGRTEKLAKRLTDHLAAAAFSGGEVVGVVSIAVDNPEAAEYDLVRKLTDHPRSVVVHGKETFSGLTFLEVVTIADRVARASVALPELVPGSFLVRCMEVMDAEGLARVSLNRLRLLLNDATIQTNRDLGSRLRHAGVDAKTIYLPDEQDTAKGIRREWLGGRPPAPAELAPGA